MQTAPGPSSVKRLQISVFRSFSQCPLCVPTSTDLYKAPPTECQYTDEESSFFLHIVVSLFVQKPLPQLILFYFEVYCSILFSGFTWLDL